MSLLASVMSFTSFSTMNSLRECYEFGFAKRFIKKGTPYDAH